VAGSEDPRALLRSVFGFDDFRPGQEEIVRAVLAGEDAIAIMPTGSGKSLCYQLPALLRPGLTMVVSPLIALMRDQVQALRAAAIAAAALNSANPAAENAQVERDIELGKLKLLYIAPERLVRPDTLERLAGANVALLAIDEAHCVSQWGHDFRPDYLGIANAARAIGGRLQTLALTATADGPTRAEIARRLFEGRSPREFLRSFDRPNLRLTFAPKKGPAKQVLDFVRRHTGESGIVYCSTRRKTDEMADALVKQGVRALPYHAGLEKEVREANQDVFQKEDGVVMVATVAFGLGIDKPDVRFVCHADLPSSVEAYYQEIGRAGRDGLPADTLTLYGTDDIRLRRMFIANSAAPDDRKRLDRQRLAALLSLAEAPHCRRQTLLAYFGETTPPCGNCDLCTEGTARFDGTVEAQKAMSAILRTGERFGVAHLIAILTGDSTENVLKFGHERLPTFGVGKDRAAGEWHALFRQMSAAGLIEQDLEGYGRWMVTEAGRRVLRGEERIEFRAEAVLPGKSVRRGSKTAPPELSGSDSGLLVTLKTWRLARARELSAPAYVVCSDRTLYELVAMRPASVGALRGVHGLGDAKIARYGAAIVELIATTTSARSPE